LSGSFTTEKLNKINRNDITRSSGTPSGLNTSHLNSQTIYEFVGKTSEGLSAKCPKCVGETSDPCWRNVSGSKSLSAKRPHPVYRVRKVQHETMNLA